jgi:hypothetical protein
MVANYVSHNNQIEIKKKNVNILQNDSSGTFMKISKFPSPETSINMPYIKTSKCDWEI